MVAILRSFLKIIRSGRSSPEADEQKALQTERLEIYKLMVEMADRVSQRRQTANSFYLSINTLLVSGSAYLDTTNPATKNLAITLAGALVSILWIKSIESYKTLNTAKFAVINELELGLVSRPYTEEWKKLDPDGDGKRHRPFYKTEITVPKIFLGIYAVQAFVLIPWEKFLSLVIKFGCV